MRAPSPSPRIARRALVALTLATGACPGAADKAPATADIEPLGASGVSGAVEFHPQPGGTIKVEARLRGLSPGNHGFHIHEYGDCSAQDGSSAGDHFNPTMTRHGGPDSPIRHAGDLGNITADAKGEATLNREVDGLTLTEGNQAVVGRALIVHATGDDLASQPSGQSGAPIACGVIRLSSGDTTPVRP